MSIQIPDGTLAIIEVPSLIYNVSDFLQIRDKTPRPGFDHIQSGIPGGGVGSGESRLDAMYRELWEEAGIESYHLVKDLRISTFHYKLRTKDICNKNFIFKGTLKSSVDVKNLKTNDEAEVSKIHSKSFMEMLGMYKYDWILQGTMRIILLDQLGIREGKLHEPVLYKGVYY
jgi:ADP-ribose pyrophosphatase YjhB (NUDIX family)